jgi:hypothetical protein
VVGYPLDQMREEVACIAMHFHWSLESLLEMEHGDRRQWVGVIGRQKLLT